MTDGLLRLTIKPERSRDGPATCCAEMQPEKRQGSLSTVVPSSDEVLFELSHDGPRWVEDLEI